MKKKLEDDVKGEYLAVFGVVSLVLFLLVIAITSKHFHESMDQHDLTKEIDSLYTGISPTQNTKITVHSIKEIYLIKEFKKTNNYSQSDYIENQTKHSDRLKENWEFKNN